MLFSDQNDAVNINKGDLELMVCSNCGFVFNAAFEPEKMHYSADYDNSQICSPYFENYVNNLIDYLLIEKKLRNSTILEVGCGKGYFLKKLIESYESNNIGYGFDPSYIGPEIESEGRLHFEKKYFDSPLIDISADVIICRHVIEHIPDPIKLLSLIKHSFIHAPSPQAYFETPCIEWILKNHVLWDFFYEHCSYFSVNSLAIAMEHAEFMVQNVRHIFGDQYLWFEAKPRDFMTCMSVKRPYDTIKLCNKYEEMEIKYIKEWRSKLKEMAQSAPIGIMGCWCERCDTSKFD